MAKKGEATAVLTEPIIQDCKFITGMSMESSRGSYRLVAWVELPYLGGETRERRIVSRLAMTKQTARDVRDLLGDMLRND